MLQPKNMSFRLFNWAVMLDKRSEMEYFALLAVYKKDNKNKVDIIRLIDKSDEIYDRNNSVLDENNWFGALYSELIETENDGKKYYTLLGWNGNDEAVNRRVIEVMTFNGRNHPVFGASVFNTGKIRIKRKIYEFSRKATMLLNYDKQFYVEETKGKNNKKKEKRIKADMIICDRLIPSMQSLTDNPEHFVPSGLYDGWVWIDGKWTLKKDVVVDNPKKNK
jgi:hypothetical protein